MYAIEATVTIDSGRSDEAKAFLESNIVPRVKEAPGAVGGYWTHSSDGKHGSGIVLFETEEGARAGAEAMPNMPRPDFVTFNGIEVREVVAHF